MSNPANMLLCYYVTNRGVFEGSNGSNAPPPMTRKIIVFYIGVIGAYYDVKA